MPKAKYQTIYNDMKRRIEAGESGFQEIIPSEYELIEHYGCSRNTVRRAIAYLAEEGYLQPVHGVGVRVIYQPMRQTAFTMGGIESFRESALRNNRVPGTKVLNLFEIVVDEKLSQRSGFAEGDNVYFLQRVRYLDDTPLILDINMFRSDLVPGLTEEIAKNSVYEYIENELGMVIATSKRSITVERVTEMDEKWLELGDYNCMAVISGQVFNSEGIMFEYTQSRHRPDCFSFHDTAVRRRMK